MRQNVVFSVFIFIYVYYTFISVYIKNLKNVKSNW